MLFDGNDLISIKIQQHPFAIILYNDIGTDLRNINISFIDLPSGVTMIPVSTLSELSNTDLTAIQYYIPISANQKYIKTKIVITFTSESDLYILQRESQIATIDSTKLCDYFDKIRTLIGFDMQEIQINFIQFSLIPCDTYQNQNLKCWANLFIIFNEGKSKVYGKQSLIKKLVPFLLHDFISNIERYTAYFSLGRELALSLDYLIMRNYSELKNALIRVNTLLSKLGIEFQFAITDLENMQATELEYLQNQILSAHV